MKHSELEKIVRDVMNNHRGKQKTRRRKSVRRKPDITVLLDKL